MLREDGGEGSVHRKPETCACRDCLGTTDVVQR